MGRLNQLGPLQAVGKASSAGLAEGPAAVSADLGGAASVGGLSVPQDWAAATPPIRLAAAALPGTGAGIASEIEAGGSENLLSEMMLASMAVRGIGGAAPRGWPTITKTVTPRPPDSDNRG